MSKNGNSSAAQDQNLDIPPSTLAQATAGTTESSAQSSHFHLVEQLAQVLLLHPELKAVLGNKQGSTQPEIQQQETATRQQYNKTNPVFDDPVDFCSFTQTENSSSSRLSTLSSHQQQQQQQQPSAASSDRSAATPQDVLISLGDSSIEALPTVGDTEQENTPATPAASSTPVSILTSGSESFEIIPESEQQQAELQPAYLHQESVEQRLLQQLVKLQASQIAEQQALDERNHIPVQQLNTEEEHLESLDESSDQGTVEESTILSQREEILEDKQQQIKLYMEEKHEASEEKERELAAREKQLAEKEHLLKEQARALETVKEKHVENGGRSRSTMSERQEMEHIHKLMFSSADEFTIIALLLSCLRDKFNSTLDGQLRKKYVEIVEKTNSYIKKQKELNGVLMHDNENLRLANKHSRTELETQVLQLIAEKEEMVRKMEELQAQADRMKAQENETFSICQNDLEEKIRKDVDERKKLKEEIAQWRREEQQRQVTLQNAIESYKQKCGRAELLQQQAEEEHQKMKERCLNLERDVQKYKLQVIELRADQPGVLAQTAAHRGQQLSSPVFGEETVQELQRSIRDKEETIHTLSQQLHLFQRDFNKEKHEKQELEMRLTKVLQHKEHNHELMKENKRLTSNIDALHDQLQRLNKQYNPGHYMGNCCEPGAPQSSIQQYERPGYVSQGSSSSSADYWSCARCTYTNSNRRVTCEICGKGKGSTMNGSEPGVWQCKLCTTTNPAGSNMCETCEANRSGGFSASSNK